MKDNMCEETAIKINYIKDGYYDNGIRKFKDTNLPLNGKYEDGDGDIRYFKNGKRHNENGPAYIKKDGHTIYYINGTYHRIDGPAVIYADGSIEWWLNDYHIDNETINSWLKDNDIPLDYKIWSDSDKILFALHWSSYNGQIANL